MKKLLVVTDPHIGIIHWVVIRITGKKSAMLLCVCIMCKSRTVCLHIHHRTFIRW